MGLFTTVTARFPCAHCGRNYLADVQFKTGDADALRVLAEHERAEELRPGAYEGVAGACCATCAVRWWSDGELPCFAPLVVISEERVVRVVRAN